jgi:uncharacterized protein YjbJ (UPF0337 family)
MRVEGAMERFEGKVVHAIGKLLGNARLQAEGLALERKGQAREETGKLGERAKATTEEAAGAVKRGVGTLTGDERMRAEGAVEQKKGEERHRWNQ